MPVSPRQRPLMRWLITIGACLAIVGQLSVAIATLAEEREGRGMGAHVEAAGTSTHYAHNDATCAVCQARSLQGLTARASEPLVANAVRLTAIVAASGRLLAPELFSPSNPRAPPSAS